MRTSLDRLTPQPLIAVVTSALALVALAAGYSMPAADHMLVLAGPHGAFIALLLALMVVLAYHFPIHIRPNTKIWMASVPVYLMAVFLSPVLAGLAAGGGVLTAEMVARSQRKNYPSDIATQCSRWILLAVAGSWVTHLSQVPANVHPLLLIGAAGALWGGDILTSPLLLAPMTGEHPLKILRAILPEAGPAEAAQYLVGLLGALAATQQIWALALLALPTWLVYLAFKSAKELQEGTRHLLEQMADIVDLRDPYTGGHSRRVTELCGVILEQLGIDAPEGAVITAAARVHDIGKIGIPDAILKKPGKLTPEEWAIMETHSERGADLLLRYPDFARGVEIVRHHHERWDGTGYPHRLKGAEIPFGARVIAVADSFDAMITDRPYRSGMSVDRATTILREGRGQQWDGAVVDAFLRNLAEQDVEPEAVPAHLQIVSPASS